MMFDTPFSEMPIATKMDSQNTDGATLGASKLPFVDFAMLSDEEAIERAAQSKKTLGSKAVILCHHYQRPEVFRFADITGDSLRLSQLASQSTAEYLVFCGVHFMAEVADMLSSENQTAILPDLAAGCSMADMANLQQVEEAWDSLLQNGFDPDNTITPITYINSTAEIKAFCGRHGGIVCTSSNTAKILQWAFAQRPRVLFFPDQHLGRWTGHRMGMPHELMQVWNPNASLLGGLTQEQVQASKILLWQGHCSVHQMFRPKHIESFRKRFPEGKVICHPECDFSVCELADVVGSTELILNTVKSSAPGSRWLVGTELNLVRRIKEDVKPMGIEVQFMSPIVCNCSTMARIDPQHLAWVLANLERGVEVNPIRVDQDIAHHAVIALQRMLAVS